MCMCTFAQKSKASERGLKREGRAAPKKMDFEMRFQRLPLDTGPVAPLRSYNIINREIAPHYKTFFLSHRIQSAIFKNLGTQPERTNTEQHESQNAKMRTPHTHAQKEEKKIYTKRKKNLEKYKTRLCQLRIEEPTRKKETRIKIKGPPSASFSQSPGPSARSRKKTLHTFSANAHVNARLVAAADLSSK